MIHLPRLAAIALVAALTPLETVGAALEPAANRQAAPALTLEDLSGRVHKLSDYRGNVLVVNFWATWCPPCRAEMPSLNRAAQTLGKAGVRFGAVNIGEAALTISRFVERYPLEMPVLLDQKQRATQRWAVFGLPTTVVVDRQGDIAFHVTGGHEWDKPAILRQLRALARDRGS